MKKSLDQAGRGFFSFTAQKKLYERRYGDFIYGSKTNFDTTVEQIKEKYELSEEEAVEKTRQYWK